ncbi:MAG: CRISPR-associated helicase Cas3', partial [Candidatus Helarchaeota archaeon]
SKVYILKEQYNRIEWNCLKTLEPPRISWKEIEEYIEDLFVYADEFGNKEEYFFLLKYLFSILLYSDKNEAIFSGVIKFNKLPEKCTSLIKNYKDKYLYNKRKSSSMISMINILRESIHKKAIKKLNNISNERVYFLNIPTGLGKTLTGLQCALELINKHKHLDKIIYAVPYTSIIDQIGEVINKIFKINSLDINKYFIKHHYLVEPKIRIDENVWEGEKGQFLIENWDHSIVLTTFWQIFYTIFSGENKLNRKYYQLCNSVLILDEIQILPFEYWLVVKKVLKIMTEVFNCKIIYMTATLPLIFSKDETEGKNLIEDDDFPDLKSINRYNLNVLNSLDPININEIIFLIEKKIFSDKKVLVVLNTIQESLLLYNLFKKKLNIPILYLSTNIVPIDRVNRINKIKNNSGPMLVISTQLIEAGVDIDFDYVFRDLAPFDSIVQSAGRCNRNMKDIGEVYLFTLYDDENQSKYASYIYSDISLAPTVSILKNKKKLSEQEVYALLKEYYFEIQKRMANNRSFQLMENITNINFNKIVKNFVLIENYPDKLVFIEKDDMASEILKNYKHIYENFELFDRRDKFLKIKKKIFEYVLSVRINQKTIPYLKSFEEVSNFLIMPRDMVDQFYRFDIGLNLKLDNFI